MKKKSLVTMLAALALVGTVGVGATLAYFTAETDVLENKFVFNANGIKLGLEEIVEDDEVIPAGEDYQYDDLVPGAVVDKMPYVTMPDGSVPAYVFLKVEVVADDNTAPADALTITGYDTTEWMDVTAQVAEKGDAAKYYVYVKDAEEGSFAVVSPNGEEEGVTKTEPIFTNVKISSKLTGEEVLPTIVIDAAAVQASEGETPVSTEVALEAVKDLF